MNVSDRIAGRTESRRSDTAGADVPSVYSDAENRATARFRGFCGA
jgi:hypothetical protein